MNDLKSILILCYELTDRWCERKEKKCLSLLLPALYSPLVHSDQLHDLLEAMKDVKGFQRKELKEEELTLLIEAINALESILTASQT